MKTICNLSSFVCLAHAPTTLCFVIHPLSSSFDAPVSTIKGSHKRFHTCSVLHLFGDSWLLRPGVLMGGETLALALRAVLAGVVGGGMALPEGGRVAGGYKMVPVLLTPLRFDKG